MRVRLKGINSVRKRLADGTWKTYRYAWKGGPPLCGEPGTPDFHATYNEAVARKVAPPRGTLLSLLQAYQASGEFLRLAEATRKSYVWHIKRIEKEFGDYPLSGLTDRRTRGIFFAWRDRVAVDLPITLGRCSRACCRGGSTAAWRQLTPAPVVVASITPRGATMSGPMLTRPDSSSARPRTCTCRCCSGYGPASGKAISGACSGQLTTAHISGCSNRKPAFASSSRSARH